MKTILVQGINANVGTSSIASAVTYQLSELNKRAVFLDANAYQQSNSGCNLLGLDTSDISNGWYTNLKDYVKGSNPFSNCFYKYENNAYCIPFGKIDDTLLDIEKKIPSALEYLDNQNIIDYLIIDAGIRNNFINKALLQCADIIFTIIQTEGNSLQRLNSIEVLNNEFFIINKFNSACSPFAELLNLLMNSKLKQSIIKTPIPFDESVIRAYMGQMPFNRFLKISSAALELEKIVMELFIMCNDTQETKEQS